MRRWTGMMAILALTLWALALALTATAQDQAGDRAAAADEAPPAAAEADDDAPADAALAAFGRTVYRVYCDSCHGAAAEGDGRIAEYLKIPPADLTTLRQRNDGHFPTERVRSVIDGREPVRGHAGEMPVWGDAFQKTDALENRSPEEREEAVAKKIDSLVHYLKSIQK